MPVSGIERLGHESPWPPIKGVLDVLKVLPRVDLLYAFPSFSPFEFLPECVPVLRRVQSEIPAAIVSR